MQAIRPFDIVHVSSAHPWTDNRVHRREAASAASAGYRTALVAVAEPSDRIDDDWERPEPDTGVYVLRIRRRTRRARVLRSSWEAVRHAIRSRARVVHLHDPELAWAIPVLRGLGRRVIYDAHEDLPDQVRGKPYLARVVRTVAVGAAHIVLVIARGADATVAATPAIAARLRQDRTVLVRNFPRHLERRAVVPPSSRPPRAVYIGALSADRGVHVLARVAAAPELPDGWVVTTAGRADAEAGLVLAASASSAYRADGHSADDRDADDRGVAHRGVDHRGVLHPVDAIDLLHTARVGLLPLLPTPAFTKSIPTKLFEYMAAGLAVVATDIPEWRVLLRGADCVTWVPAGDAAAIVAAIRRYADDPALLERHSEAALQSARDDFRWEHEEARLLALYDRVFGTRPVSVDACR